MVRPGMADGRCFTSYISNCQMNDNIKTSNEITTDSNYRRFLQDNGKPLMQTNSQKCKSDDNKLCDLSCKPFK